MSVVAAIFVTLAPPARSPNTEPPPSDCNRAASEFDCYGAGNGSITIGIGRAHNGAPGHSGDNGLPVASSQAANVAAMGAAFCADASANAAASGGLAPEVSALCHGLAALPVAPTQEQVFTAFRELPLYRGAVRTDPRNSTLVNLETYFWCGDADARTCEVIGQGERTVTLLGQPVRIRPRIIAYDWAFGDGAGQQITAGRATHTYAHATTADVSVTLTWTADYAVGPGAFQPIGDTTTTTSPVRALPVREAEAVIVTGS